MRKKLANFQTHQPHYMKLAELTLFDNQPPTIKPIFQSEDDPLRVEPCKVASSLGPFFEDEN